jgi:hypothetical protein
MWRCEISLKCIDVSEGIHRRENLKFNKTAFFILNIYYDHTWHLIYLQQYTQFGLKLQFTVRYLLIFEQFHFSSHKHLYRSNISAIKEKAGLLV